jgi:hypothetical protein
VPRAGRVACYGCGAVRGVDVMLFPLVHNGRRPLCEPCHEAWLLSSSTVSGDWRELSDEEAEAVWGVAKGEVDYTPYREKMRKHAERLRAGKSLEIPLEAGLSWRTLRLRHATAASLEQLDLVWAPHKRDLKDRSPLVCKLGSSHKRLRPDRSRPQATSNGQLRRAEALAASSA